MCTESGMLQRCDCKIAKQQINITIIIMWLSFCDRQKKHFMSWIHIYFRTGYLSPDAHTQA